MKFAPKLDNNAGVILLVTGRKTVIMPYMLDSRI